jgi:hypothetical protein
MHTTTYYIILYITLNFVVETIIDPRKVFVLTIESLATLDGVVR